MKNIKRLGLTLIMLITTSSLALAQESEIVMTKAELESFLETVAQNRRDQLKALKSGQKNGYSVHRNDKVMPAQGNDRVMYQLDRINDRIDNLFILHAGGVPNGSNSSTIVVPGSTHTSTGSNHDLTIAELQRQLDALKAEKLNNNLNNLVDETLEDRIENAETPEERRDALKDLLAKFKNYKKQVFFANDSDELYAEDLEYINDVTQVLNKYEEFSIVLEGWASPRGNANYNKQLSMRRSESVEKALIEKGIAAERIVSSFKGEDHSTTEAKARRVDMSVILK